MKNFLHLILLFLSMKCLAQGSITDSLKTLLLTSKEDTNKVLLLDQLSEYYSWSFADTALLYAQKELQLSQKLNFESGKAYSMLDMGNAYTTLGNYPLALDFLFKSLALFRKLNDSSGIAYALGGLGLCYRDQQDYKQAVKIYTKHYCYTRVD